MLLAVGGHVSRKQHWLPGHIQDCLEQVSMQHPQDRGCSMASPKWRERSAWKKKKKRKSLASECHSNTSFSETRNAAGSSFPVSKCSPNISSYRVIGFSSPSFLRGLTVLHPNSYLEKAATRQIKLHCGFLAPESDIGNSAHPTNQSQQPRHVLSQDGKPDLRG